MRGGLLRLRRLRFGLGLALRLLQVAREQRHARVQRPPLLIDGLAPRLRASPAAPRGLARRRSGEVGIWGY